MFFYVVKNQSSGTYLSMQGDTWVPDVQHAAIFTLKSTATHSIRRAWLAFCCVERIEQLPNRIPNPERSNGGPTTTLG